MERPWMIVLTDVHVLADRDGRRPDPAVSTLASHGIPVVLVSDGEAAAVAEAQGRLGLRQPFISRGGAALHVPDGYFEQMPVVDRASRDGWSVLDFVEEDRPADCSRAVRLLLLLYWTNRDDGRVVAVTDRHQGLLEHADIPIIVRNPGIDQQGLRQACPAAYVTQGTGCAGWAEAILGPVEA
jgi:hypothetical protein